MLFRGVSSSLKRETCFATRGVLAVQWSPTLTSRRFKKIEIQELPHQHRPDPRESWPESQPKGSFERHLAKRKKAPRVAIPENPPTRGIPIPEPNPGTPVTPAAIAADRSPESSSRPYFRRGERSALDPRFMEPMLPIPPKPTQEHPDGPWRGKLQRSVLPGGPTEAESIPYLREAGDVNAEEQQKLTSSSDADVAESQARLEEGAESEEATGEAAKKKNKKKKGKGGFTQEELAEFAKRDVSVLMLDTDLMDKLCKQYAAEFRAVHVDGAEEGETHTVYADIERFQKKWDGLEGTLHEYNAKRKTPESFQTYEDSSPRVRALLQERRKIHEIHPGAAWNAANLTAEPGKEYRSKFGTQFYERPEVETLAQQRSLIANMLQPTALQKRQLGAIFSDYHWWDHQLTYHIVDTYPHGRAIAVVTIVGCILGLYALQQAYGAFAFYDEYLGLDLRRVPEMERPIIWAVAIFFTMNFLLHPAGLLSISLTRVYRILRGRPVGPP